jgi:Tfp pilus assembly major pilin PilA
MVKSNKGFAVFELVMIIVIITILAAVLIPLLSAAKNRQAKTVENIEISTATIPVDGCQYLAQQNAYDKWIIVSHKGNCTNRAHVYRADLEEEAEKMEKQ